MSVYYPKGALLLGLMIDVRVAVREARTSGAPLSSYHIPPALMKAICNEEGLAYSRGHVELIVEGVPVLQFAFLPPAPKGWAGDPLWQSRRQAV